MRKTSPERLSNSPNTTQLLSTGIHSLALGLSSSHFIPNDVAQIQNAEKVVFPPPKSTLRDVLPVYKVQFTTLSALQVYPGPKIKGLDLKIKV